MRPAKPYEIAEIAENWECVDEFEEEDWRKEEVVRAETDDKEAEITVRVTQTLVRTYRKGAGGIPFEIS